MIVVWLVSLLPAIPNLFVYHVEHLQERDVYGCVIDHTLWIHDANQSAGNQTQSDVTTPWRLYNLVMVTIQVCVSRNSI